MYGAMKKFVLGVSGSEAFVALRNV